MSADRIDIEAWRVKEKFDVVGDSMLDVDFGDLIDYLGNDSSTKSILLYIESLTHPIQIPW